MKTAWKTKREEIVDQLATYEPTVLILSNEYGRVFVGVTDLTTGKAHPFYIAQNKLGETARRHTFAAALDFIGV